MEIALKRIIVRRGRPEIQVPKFLKGVKKLSGRLFFYRHESAAYRDKLVQAKVRSSVYRTPIV